ncbi:MAG TPA: hypothetical protein VLG76_06685 [Rhabdochlamydiaceae bacterium]|nr:hypothetical protein [Rhabdochlamydiaceae bacterium]
MISQKVLLFGAIFAFALVLFLGFPTRLPFNLSSSLSNVLPSGSLSEPKSLSEQSSVKKINSDTNLYISQNLGKGQYFQVSDGFYYKIAPDDVRLAAYWLGPAPICCCIGDDDDYPIQITNTYSGTTVRARLSSYDEIISQMKELQAPAPQEPVEPVAPEQPAQPAAPTAPPEEPEPAPQRPLNQAKKPAPNPNKPVAPPTRSQPSPRGGG